MSENKAIYRVLIADDHDIVADGYRTMLIDSDQFSVVGVVKNGKEVQTFLETNDCDILVLDINMPGMNGVQTIQYLKERHSEIKILVVSMLTSPLLVKKILDLGVSGYLYKTSGADQLQAALDSIIEGIPYFEETIVRAREARFVSSFEVGGRKIDISPRELEIIKMVSLGKSAIEIADQLNISTHTVQTHRRNINIKLNTHNTAELISFAIRNSIISFE